MKLKKGVLNKVAIQMMKLQNNNNKLGIGEMREMASLFVRSVVYLSKSDVASLLGTLAEEKENRIDLTTFRRETLKKVKAMPDHGWR